MILFEFEVRHQILHRVHTNLVVSCIRNDIYANFTFSDDWKDITPIIAQFKTPDGVWDAVITNGSCAVPWEAVEKAGTLSISVCGGDLITTNSVEICVHDSGLVGGLKPTKASPGLYGNLQDKVNKLSDEVVTEQINADIAKLKDIEVSDIKYFDESNTKYESTSTKVKTSTAGFEITAETAQRNGTKLKNSIKTSNSKMTFDVADLEFKSAKNERHNTVGNYQINSSGDVVILAHDGEILKAGGSVVTLKNSFNPDVCVELGQSNAKIAAEYGDINLESRNIRNEISGTYEVLSDAGNGSIIRFINYNGPEDRCTKVYLGEDKAIIGVDDGYSESSFITGGVETTEDGVNLIGNIKLNGSILSNLVEKYMTNLFLPVSKNEDLQKVLVEANGGLYIWEGSKDKSSEKMGDNVTAYVCSNNDIFLLGSGDTYDYSPVPDYYGSSSYLGYDGMSSITNYPPYNNGTDGPYNKVYIGDGVTRLGNYLFGGNSCITEINIPKSVTSISESAFGIFDSCENLKEITVDNDNPTYHIDDGVLFDNNKNIIQVPKAKTGSYAIPNGVTDIPEYCFCNTSLTTIAVPDSVTSIGNYAFLPNHTNLLKFVFINKPANSISGAPWGATNATVIWKG